MGYEKAFRNLQYRSENRNLANKFTDFITQSSINSVRYGICTSDGTYSSSIAYLKNKNKVKESIINNRNKEIPFNTFLQNSQYYEISSTKLPRGLRYIDRSSSYSGREARVPLLNNKIIGLSLSLPSFRKIDIAKSRMESVEEVRTRMKDSLEHIDEHRLIAAPDCGLGFFTREQAIEKMTILSKAAKSI